VCTNVAHTDDEWQTLESELQPVDASSVECVHNRSKQQAWQHDDADVEAFRGCISLGTKRTTATSAPAAASAATFYNQQARALEMPLPPLEQIFPAAAKKAIHVCRGVIRTLRYPKLRDLWQSHRYPVKANFVLEDIETGKSYDVIAKMNGLEPDLLEIDGYVSTAINTTGKDAGKHSLVYIQVRPRPMYRDNYVEMLKIIRERHMLEHQLLGRSSGGGGGGGSGGSEDGKELQNVLAEFEKEALELPWNRTSYECPMDLLWWLASQYPRKKWAVTLLDSMPTAMVWISYVCPEALLFWKADTLMRLSIGQLMDLRYQMTRYGWKGVMFRKTWVSSSFIHTERHVLDLRTPYMVQHDSGADDPRTETRRYQRSRTGIRHEDAHPLEQVSYDSLDQLHRHWTSHGPAVVVGTPTPLPQDADDYGPYGDGSKHPSFDPLLIVLLRLHLTPRDFQRYTFFEVFDVFLRPSTMIPLGHPTSLFEHQGNKARVVLNPQFVQSITLPPIRNSYRCEARFLRMLRLYYLVYIGHAQYSGPFQLTPPECAHYLSELVTNGDMVVWFTRVPLQLVYVMTRDALENAVFMRHAMVRFTVNAEQRQLEERVVQYVDPDNPLYHRLHPLQRSLFDGIQSSNLPRIVNVTVIGSGGVGKSACAELIDLVENRNGAKIEDLEFFQNKPLPRLFNPRSPLSGKEYIWYALTEPELADDARRLQAEAESQRRLIQTSSGFLMSDEDEDALMMAMDEFEQSRRAVLPLDEMPVANLNRSDESLPPLEPIRPNVLTASSTFGGTPDNSAQTYNAAHEDHGMGLNLVYAANGTVIGINPHSMTHGEYSSWNSNDANAPIQLVRTGKAHALMLTPTRSTAHDARRRFNIATRTFANLQTKAGFGLNKALMQTKVVIQDEYSQQGSDAATGVMRALLQMDTLVNICLGDVLQLDPVAPGNQLVDLYEMLDGYRTRKARQMAQQGSQSIVPSTSRKTIPEIIETDDLDYVCERSLLIELTHNHRVHSEASDLLHLITMIRQKQLDALRVWESPVFSTLPLSHPERGYFDSDMNIAFNAEDRTLIELYDRYANTPAEYQIIVGTNAYRHLVNALIARRVGIRFDLKENIFARSGGLGVTDTRGGRSEKYDGDDGVIVPGSLRVKQNMKLLFRWDFRQDRQKMDSNTIYIAIAIIDVPEVMLDARKLEQHREKMRQKNAATSGSSRSTAAAAALAAAASRTSAVREEFMNQFSVADEIDSHDAHAMTDAALPNTDITFSNDVLSVLTWEELCQCTTVQESMEASPFGTVRCVVLRNLKTDNIEPQDTSGAATFFVVRCTPSFYFHIDLAYAVTSYFMQGLSAPHIYFVMERSYPTHQKLLNTAASRAIRSVTIYVQNAGSPRDARLRMVEAVDKNAPDRFTALWLVLQDRLDITFRRMHKMLPR
jgi:hypothetical protein